MSLSNERFEVLHLLFLDFVALIGLATVIDLTLFLSSGLDHLGLELLPSLASTSLLRDDTTSSETVLGLVLEKVSISITIRSILLGIVNQSEAGRTTTTVLSVHSIHYNISLILLVLGSKMLSDFLTRHIGTTWVDDIQRLNVTTTLPAACG